MVDQVLIDAERDNSVSTISSILSGIGSGLIQIPKGAFSLGATLYDLGAGTNKAAEVEKYFDDLTELDEKAEATTAGKITQALVNLGVPGVYGFKLGSTLARNAITAKKTGNYFTLNNPALRNAADKAIELNTKGKLATFAAGAVGGGLSDAVFVGDVEDMGTFGDLLGGPTELDRGEGEDDYDPVRELINRTKFGTESALFAGLIGGTGASLKKLAERGKYLRFSHNREDRLLDKIASFARARGGKTQEYFDIERLEKGRRSVDLNLAQEISRTLDQDIDSIFPAWKTVADKKTAKQRTESLGKINDLLLSGDPAIDNAGKVTFGNLNEELKQIVVNDLKAAGAKDETIQSILSGLSVIRTGWGDMFSAIGGKIDPKDLGNFKKLFGSKFKNYLGSTYDIFQNRSIIPFLGFKPTEEAIQKTKEMFKQAAIQNGRPITDLEAEGFVERLIKSARLPDDFRMDKPADPMFKIPDFFVGKTVLDDAVKGDGYISLKDLPKENKEIIEELLGKTKNPMQTILGGTARLSLVTRRNQFFQDLLVKSDELSQRGKGIFYDNEADALRNLGPDFRKIDFKKGNNLEAGITNPLEGKYAITEIADALEETAAQTRSNSIIGKIYENFILYPKATSQLAKTVLSPITHIRNFISAGAFATANGIIPTPKAMREAYSALQTALPGTRQSNELYRRLLELGVVNKNVALGDLNSLLKDISFGETINSDKFLSLMLRPLSKLKKFSEDLYTAEDDFWKITSWAMEKDRLAAAYTKAGINKTVKELEEEAADIIRNNIPNYDYVGDFIKGLRRLPLGNFVSFPAEIIRTSTNIVRRALDEITMQVRNDKGELVKPLAGIGYKRLIGMTTTAAAVPTAVVEGAKALYDVTEDEIEAMRRYVADWSRNSTLIPIRDKETGELKYIDFSHANAYDLLYRPFQSVFNAVAEGRTDKDGIMNDFMKGLGIATKEIAEPFITEAIWTEAITDILVRGGRTRDNVQIYNPEDTDGNKMIAIIKHLVESQAPFSYEQMKRLDLSVEPIDVIQKGKFDKLTGQTYELSDELAGFTGFRPVKVDVERGLKYKVAEYQKGVRESRQLFTRNTLRGGPVTPEEVVDAYLNANRALFNVRKDFYKDLKAAETLGTNEDIIRKQSERISGKEFQRVNTGIFTPLNISEDIQQAFADIAQRLELENPYEQARDVISNIQQQLINYPLTERSLPVIENPFKNLAEPTLAPIQGLPPLPNPTDIQGYGQINLPTAVAGGPVNPITKLTPVEQALLSPSEQAIRQKQRTT
ncbi:MAG: hypothetical protein EBZ92_06130 [Actinobacteria bacterium]|nr:hypothetical protein [Actinomycetota bacterium]